MRSVTAPLVYAAALLFTAAPAGAGPRSVRLRQMVAVGDSMLAGFSSGGLVRVGHPGQLDSVPALIARRAHVRLPLPAVTRPGLPPPFQLVDANRNGRLDPGEVVRSRSGVGLPLGRPSHNLAVPGEDSATVFEAIDGQEVANHIFSDGVDGRRLLKLLMLPSSTPASQVTLARELQPTFLLVWLGYDEVVTKTIGGGSAAGTIDPEEFGRRFRKLLDALAETETGMAVANLADPTRIAALRRAGGEVTSCRNAGTTELVAADDLLSIDLDPALLPTPPCGKVLDAGERADIRAKVVAVNAEIAGAVQDVERARGTTVALVDVFTAFDAAAAAGLDLDKDGAPDLTTGYLGGIFSLDGIHPTRTGNALIANLFIDAINARFGEEIPRVNVRRVAAHDPLVHNPFRPAGEPPFGLIGESEDDDLESLWPQTYARIQRDAPAAIAALLFAEFLAGALGHVHLPPLHLF